MIGGSINEQSTRCRGNASRVDDRSALESTTAVRGYDDSGDVLIALTGTFMYAEVQHTVSDWE